MSVKINALELENVKRIKAVKIDPTKWIDYYWWGQ